MTTPPGYYPDPDPTAPPGQQRWWDGNSWTAHTTPPTLATAPAAAPAAGHAHPAGHPAAPGTVSLRQPQGRAKVAIIAAVFGLVGLVVLGALVTGSGRAPGGGTASYTAYSAPDVATTQQLADATTARVVADGWPQDTTAAAATVIGSNPSSPLNRRQMSSMLCGYNGAVPLDAFWGADASGETTIRLAVAGLGRPDAFATLGANLAERTEACTGDELAEEGAEVLLRETAKQQQAAGANGAPWTDYTVTFGALAHGTDGGEHLLLLVYRNHGVFAAQVVLLVPADDPDRAEDALNEMAATAHALIDATLEDALDAEVLAGR